MWHHNMIFLFYFLLSWLVHTCRDRYVDALWQSIQNFEDFLLLSCTSMSCNVEIATWHEPQSRWLKLMFTPILWMNPASKFQNMDECVSNWWLVWLPILIFSIIIFMVPEQYRQIHDCYYESSLVTIVPFSLPLQRFKEAINGLADAGWSVIESDLSNLSNLFCLMCSFLNFLCQFLVVIKLGNDNNYQTRSCSMICLYAFLRYQMLVFDIF